MEAELETELGGDCLGHKRVDPEGGSSAGDVRRPREGENGLHSPTMEIEDDGDGEDWEPEPNPLDLYRECWIESYGCHGIFFDDETDRPPMRNTDGPIISNGSGPMSTMQVLYVKVTQITDAFKWPLHVYGLIAVRSQAQFPLSPQQGAVPSPRLAAGINRFMKDVPEYLYAEIFGLFSISVSSSTVFSSTNGVVVLPQVEHRDAVLELTGPTRAVLLMDPHAFEIDLKVRVGESPSDDKTLNYNAFIYNNIAHSSKASYARTEVVPHENSTIEVRFAHLAEAVEATIEVIIVSGSRDFKARFTARTASIDECMVLLDSRGEKVAVTENGEVVLKRRIVTVEERGKLLLDVEAAESNGVVVQKRIKLTPRSALRTDGYFELGFSRMRVIVAWSLLP